MSNDNFRPEYQPRLVAVRRSHHLTEAEVVEGLAGVQPVGEPIPRDEAKFKRLSPDPQVPVDARIPTTDKEWDAESDRISDQIADNGRDGN